VLLRIDDTGFASSYGEQRARYFSLVAAVARLEAEISETSPVFPVDVQNAAPDILASEVALYQNRQSELQSSIDILRRQVEQKEQEQRELQNRLEQQQRSYQLAVKELEITAPLEKEGAVSKVELLRLERQVNDLKGDMDAARLALPRVEAALQEANRRIEERVLKFRSDALAELADKKEQLARIGQSIVAAEDRVTRTLVRSPVRGTVKQVLVSTVGGVVKPGMDLVEIVPLEDNLLVEARVRPQDIAFIRPGQDVMVKISAYDFSIYGGLPARLEQISADTITSERGESYYLVRVRTERSSLGAESNPLPIIPGMVATVDIITGKKTVLAYMLKPVLKASENALRER
jgi:adhesin transport system membrane fusion protein